MIEVDSQGIINGYIADRFGKFGDEKIDNVSTRSLPVSWENLPSGTKSLVLVIQDHDAVPVCGFSWIHWLVADIPPGKKGLPENASRDDKSLIQGKNSLASKQICGEMNEDIINHYGGPRPPNGDHEYEIIIYALDRVLGLKTGFMLNELYQVMRGHILDSGALLGKYRSQ